MSLYDPQNSVVSAYEDRERRERIAERDAPERSEFWDDDLEQEVYPERQNLKCCKCGHVWSVAGTLREYSSGFFLNSDDDEFCPVCESDDALGVGVSYDVRR